MRVQALLEVLVQVGRVHEALQDLLRGGVGVEARVGAGAGG